ncbi:MAG: hypothetical protein ACXWLE_12640 [Rhizomicrobium sp.]
MRFRVFIGPRGAEQMARLEKDQYLFKEFASLDEAFSWARHVNNLGRVTLLIDCDDGTHMAKHEIAAALHNADRLSGEAA